MKNSSISRLKPQVDYNCNVSDAHFWGVYSICGLLLRLRQRYMWENGIKPWEKLNYSGLGEFIEEREKLWQELKDDEIKEIQIHGRKFSPFDMGGINRVLTPLGYCYGGGYALGMKPSFFLAELHETQQKAGFDVYIAGREISRDLYSSPAMLVDRKVFFRLESEREFLWEKMQEARTASRRVFLREFMEAYGLLGKSEEEMWEELGKVARDEMDVLFRHEVAEAKVSTEETSSLIRKYAGTPAELVLRALVDLRSDFCHGGMIEYIIAERRKASLALYFMNLTGIRRRLVKFFAKVQREEGSDWSKLEGARQEQDENLRESFSSLLAVLRSGESYRSIRPQLKAEVFDPLGLNL